MGLTFEPTAIAPRAWTVLDAGGVMLGSVAWHDRLGAFGFAARPGLPLVFDRPALEEVGHFVDAANAG